MTVRIRILLLLLCTLSGYAQEDVNSDSLKQVLAGSNNFKIKAQAALTLTNFFKNIHPDSSKIYLNQLIEFAEKSGDRRLQGHALLAEANHLQNLTFFDKSIAANQKAIQVFEEIGDNQGIASGYNTLGLTYKKNSGDNIGVEAFSKRALQYEHKALKYYELADDTDGFLRVHSNIGIIHRDLLEYDEAEKFYLKGLNYAKKRGLESYSVGILNANLSQIYLDHYKEYDKAISLLNEALRIYKKNGIVTSQEHAFRNLSFNYSAKGDYQKAIFYAKKAVKIALDVKDPHRQKSAFGSLYVAQKGAGLFGASLKSLEALGIISDSLLSAEKAEIIAEMDARFAVVKKDAEIAVLSSEVKVDKFEKKVLLLGLLFLAMIAAYIFWSMRQKSLKEKLIANKDKIIQREKVKNAEIRVEFKQKELTAKILQLAKKNEFLASLKSEVEELKVNIDGSVNKTSEKVFRLIEKDASDEKQWEQFSSEFSILHQGFLEALIKKHGTFSKGELKLISLLKMNLSSKEIADTLNVSTDGVKKARYRLRKKMNLEDSELQSFLLNFSYTGLLSKN